MPWLESNYPWKKTRCLLTRKGNLFIFVRVCSVKVIIICTPKASSVELVVPKREAKPHHLTIEMCSTYLLLRSLLLLVVSACPTGIAFLRVFECARLQIPPSLSVEPFRLCCSVRPFRCVGQEGLIRRLHNNGTCLLRELSTSVLHCSLRLFAGWSHLGPSLYSTDR